MFRFNKNHIKMDMKKIRKVMSIFLACCLLLSINFETVFASDIETNTNADIMSLDGPSTTFDGRLFLDENGNYSGQLRSGFTTVTCVLSGRTMCPEWKNWWNSYLIYDLYSLARF